MTSSIRVYALINIFFHSYCRLLRRYFLNSNDFYCILHFPEWGRISCSNFNNNQRFSTGFKSGEFPSGACLGPSNSMLFRVSHWKQCYSKWHRVAWSLVREFPRLESCRKLLVATEAQSCYAQLYFTQGIEERNLKRVGSVNIARVGYCKKTMLIMRTRIVEVIANNGQHTNH